MGNVGGVEKKDISRLLIQIRGKYGPDDKWLANYVWGLHSDSK